MQSLTRALREHDEHIGSTEEAVRRANAYQAVFSGNATRESAEIVLVDLAIVCRFFDVEDVAVADHVLQNMAGRRAVFAHIMGHLDETAIGALHFAAIDEAETRRRYQATDLQRRNSEDR